MTPDEVDLVRKTAPAPDANLPKDGERAVTRLSRICLYGSFFTAASVAVAEEPFALVGRLRDEVALNRAHDVELQGSIAYVPGIRTARARAAIVRTP